MDVTERKRAAEALANRTEELATTVEELELIQEELRTNNDELVAAQQSLQDHGQRYLDLFESAPDGYLVTDAHGIIREANLAAGALLQEEQADLAGKPLLLFVPAALQEDYQTMLEGLASAQGVQRWETQLQTRQQTRIDAAVTVAVVRDDEGKPESLRWLLRDVTDRKRAEETLRERERLLQDVIDGSTSPIFLKDRDGKFITINATLERMLGMSREEIKGKTDYDIAPKEVADYWRNNDKKVMATGKAIQIEEVADLQDGHHIFLANKFPLVDAHGQIVRCWRHLSRHHRAQAAGAGTRGAERVAGAAGGRADGRGPASGGPVAPPGVGTDAGRTAGTPSPRGDPARPSPATAGGGEVRPCDRPEPDQG